MNKTDAKIRIAPTLSVGVPTSAIVGKKLRIK